HGRLQHRKRVGRDGAVWRDQAARVRQRRLALRDRRGPGRKSVSARRHCLMPTTEELLELAEQCAKKIDVDDTQRHIPSFSDAEEQCEDEYEELLEAIHEDEVFAPGDIQLQESPVEKR